MKIQDCKLKLSTFCDQIISYIGGLAIWYPKFGEKFKQSKDNKLTPQKEKKKKREKKRKKYETHFWWWFYLNVLDSKVESSAFCDQVISFIVFGDQSLLQSKRWVKILKQTFDVN